MWAWSPWKYATDSGRFPGRWDDQLGEFRTLYTTNSLLGCFIELLAKLTPIEEVEAELSLIEDDGSIGHHPEGSSGAVGYSWLEDREYGSAIQDGHYCLITHSHSLATLKAAYPFEQHHGINPINVDAALLKDAGRRDLTRSLARWIYELRTNLGGELVYGIEFLSRHGDEIRMWAALSDQTRNTVGITSKLPVKVMDSSFMTRLLGLLADTGSTTV
jgi:hypothetical protein